VNGRVPRAWTPELALERLQHLKARIPVPEAPAPPAYQAYLDAAAVLSWFDPATLKPLGPAPRASVLQSEFLAECVEQTEEKCRWRLRHDVRKQALKGLVQRSSVGAALAANPVRPDAPLQRLLEAGLLGKQISIEQLTPDELAAAVQVVEWLDGVVPGLPDAERLRQRLLVEELRKPLRRLAGSHFRGRKAELEQLRRYVGVLQSTSPGARVELAAEDVLSLEDRAPLILHGPGGMGKSTLLAHLILEYVDRPVDESFPFAYLDFDHPSLTIEEPLLLLAEILRQIGVQYPSARDHAEQARAEIAASRSVAEGLESFTTRQLDVGELLAVLRSVDAQDKPFLLVLDTFEEVQYTSRAFLDSLWEFLGVLQNALPRLRTIIAGRAPIDEPWFKTQELELGELDREAAAGFLEAHAIRDARLVDAIVSQVGGNPLNLKLAAEVVRKEGALALGRVFLPFAREAQIQGQLYRRILGHIHDPDVRKLAHPGLLLRVVTPELIAEVLAGPCGVAVPDAARACALFDELSREAALVTREGNVLRHRQDVRRVMLGLLRADQPGRAEEIHRRAAAFHEKRGGLLDRAEEIYHRLCLGQDPQTVDQRWITGVEPYLRSATEELPLRQRAFLTSRLGIDLDERTRREADLADWERDAEKRVRERLYAGRVEQLEEALRILDERVERTEESSLVLLEAHVLERLDRMPEAQRVAAAAVAGAKRRGGDALREARRTAERLDGKLAEASGLAQGFGQPIRTRGLTRGMSPAAIPNPRGREVSLTGQQRRALHEALLEAFPSRSALEMLVRFELYQRLDTLIGEPSLRGAISQLMEWAEAAGRLRDLVAGACRRSSENPKLAAVAAELFPDLGVRAADPAGEAPNHQLPREILLELHAAAIRAGLTRSRQALLGGIDARVVASLPSAPNAAAELLMDLTELNRMGRLADGTVPLRSWLETAVALTGPRTEASVFQSALHKLKG
jgi:hypothetical protein